MALIVCIRIYKRLNFILLYFTTRNFPTEAKKKLIRIVLLMNNTYVADVFSVMKSIKLSFLIENFYG